MRAVRNLTLAALVTGLVSAAVIGQGCEEVLEVCAACGELREGNITVSGEPRLDGTLEAAYLLWVDARSAAVSFDEEMASLAEALGVAVPITGEFTPANTQVMVDAIREQLVDTEGVTAVFEIEPGRCWIGRDVALTRQRTCEDRLNCYIPSECEAEQLGGCVGLCVGKCQGGCEGECYAEASESNEECLGGCIGACDTTEPAVCVGRCVGNCSSTCSAYDSNAQCDGRCTGVCNGDCISTIPFECAGMCRGLCQVPRGEENFCDGECRGDCSTSDCDGLCRGHFRPAGCDRPDRCEGLYGCQETAKALAWAYVRCEGASARAGVVFSPAFTGDRAEASSLAERVELALTHVARGHAMLSLLVDGVDDTGELLTEELTELAGESGELPSYLDQPDVLAGYSVVADRVHLPLSGLKARLAMLAVEATAGDYSLAAGPLPCVQPAFEEAHNMIDSLVPASDDNQPVVERTEGLYRVVDAQRILLELAWPSSE